MSAGEWIALAALVLAVVGGVLTFSHSKPTLALRVLSAVELLAFGAILSLSGALIATLMTLQAVRESVRDVYGLAITDGTASAAAQLDGGYEILERILAPVEQALAIDSAYLTIALFTLLLCAGGKKLARMAIEDIHSAAADGGTKREQEEG